MARIRTIKPEFFTSEDIVSLSPLARLLYIALWCEADRAGRMAWKPRTFKMRYLPGDDCDADALCAEIVGAGLVKLYGDGLAYIPCFLKHQHVNPRESASSLPDPDASVTRADASIPDVHAQVGKEGKGKEGEGKNDGGSASAPEIRPAVAVCLALRQEGVSAANPGHPRLMALCDAGATVGEFMALLPAAQRANPADPFAYLLGAVEGVRKRAKETSGQLHHGALRPVVSKQQAIEDHNAKVAREWAEGMRNAAG